MKSQGQGTLRLTEHNGNAVKRSPKPCYLNVLVTTGSTQVGEVLFGQDVYKTEPNKNCKPVRTLLERSKDTRYFVDPRHNNWLRKKFITAV